MFIHKLKQTKIAKKFYTNYKYIYKTKQLYNLLNNDNPFYFFFFTIHSKQKEMDLQTILKPKGYSFLKIKKKLLQQNFNKNELTFLSNLLENNILIIYSTNTISSEINNVLLKQIGDLKNFFFCGIWKNKKFFRPSEIQKLTFLNKKQLSISYNHLSLNTTKILKKKLLKKISYL